MLEKLFLICHSFNLDFTNFITFGHYLKIAISNPIDIFWILIFRPLLKSCSFLRTSIIGAVRVFEIQEMVQCSVVEKAIIWKVFFIPFLEKIFSTNSLFLFHLNLWMPNLQVVYLMFFSGNNFLTILQKFFSEQEFFETLHHGFNIPTSLHLP